LKGPPMRYMLIRCMPMVCAPAGFILGDIGLVFARSNFLMRKYRSGEHILDRLSIQLDIRSMSVLFQ
jgi:hypothetical protein